jgi:hypothetical protein
MCTELLMACRYHEEQPTSSDMLQVCTLKASWSELITTVGMTTERGVSCVDRGSDGLSFILSRHRNNGDLISFDQGRIAPSAIVQYAL